MSNNISFSSVSKYLSCPEEYRLYYKEKLRPGQVSSALIFGSAIDASFTTMLTTKSLDAALTTFKETFVDDPSILWWEIDSDPELLTQEQYEKSPAYHSMRIKGETILTSLYEEILPRIKRIIALQERIEIVNDVGDIMPIIADLVCEWENGEIILFDLKTSITPYEEDAAKTSMQLSLYYNFLKEKYGVQKLGFIVARKTLKKNRIKVCSECGFDGSGGRHALCPNKRSNGRCNAEFTVTIRPEAYLQIIINEPNVAFVNNVMETTDKVNDSIKKDVYYKNLSKCKRGKRLCDYYKFCHDGSEEGLIRKK